MNQVLFIFGSRKGVWVLGVMLMAHPVVTHNPTRPDNVPREKASQQESKSETGVASYYADKYHGKQTASGEIIDMHALTAAHPSYRFGTRVKVTHLENNRSVIVRINDRGPFVKGRVIDLSLAAAEELQMVSNGIAQVKLEIVD